MNRFCHGVIDMANGQVVLVTTEGLSGGSSTRTVYYVAEEDPTKAQAIIAKIMAPNEKVEAYGLLPEASTEQAQICKADQWGRLPRTFG